MSIVLETYESRKEQSLYQLQVLNLSFPEGTQTPGHLHLLYSIRTSFLLTNISLPDRRCLSNIWLNYTAIYYHHIACIFTCLLNINYSGISVYTALQTCLLTVGQDCAIVHE